MSIRACTALFAVMFPVAPWFAGSGPAARGDTITVCPDGSGDSATIQEGIDAAVVGAVFSPSTAAHAARIDR